MHGEECVRVDGNHAMTDRESQRPALTTHLTHYERPGENRYPTIQEEEMSTGYHQQS